VRQAALDVPESAGPDTRGRRSHASGDAARSPRRRSCVVITSTPPPKESGPGFYPEPRYVLTPYSLELSWFFQKLRDAFYAEDRIDGASKIEFFGRLANAANRYRQYATGPTSAHHLCAAVLHEAFAIYREMEEGSFKSLAVASGNEIADD